MQRETEAEILLRKNVDALKGADEVKAGQISALQGTVEAHETTIAQLQAEVAQLRDQFNIVISSRGSGATGG